MPAPKGGRRQPRMPTMPNLNLSRQQLQQTKSQADPTSPPHTPTASPQKSRKIQPSFAEASRRAPRDPHIQPVGNGHQFSYQPFIGPEQFSPRSPSSSEVPDDSGDEYSSEEEDYQPHLMKAPSPLAASDTPSSQDDSDTYDDEDVEEEGGEEEDEEDPDEELQDAQLQADAAKQSISPIGRVVDMEDDDEEEEEEEELSDVKPRIHAANRFACLMERAADTEDEGEEEEEDDEELQDSDMEKDAAKPTVSPIGRAVQMEDGSDEEEGEAEEEDDDDDDDDDDEEEEEDNHDNGEDMSRPAMESPVYATTATATTTVCDFVLEDMDPMDSDNGLSVLDPDEIESNRSRSSSKNRDNDPSTFEHKELPIRMMQDLKNLHCSAEASDEEAEQDTEEAAFYKWQQHMRRRRLSISSSITGKRTFSERSDSDDSDDAGLDVNEVGSSARRLRKRMHRGSLLFQDPPEPRIDELEEPNSSEDEFLPTQNHLGMNLPSWTIEINEMEDSQ
ncbi:hypothetical protein A9K55_000980 [Cordyceps militaris]|uniref:Uncharacterized protein n=1 Tax=Cordyceps militaris TaxID=73501 RepID=A0A2H4SV08_CORMI|nr:hypothetical protein A9K55_000980 [Cordyceps militaris]